MNARIGAAIIAALMAIPFCAQAESYKVRGIFSSSLANGQIWSIYVAGKARGIFEKHGITLEFSEGQGGGFTAQALSSGSADVAFGLAASALVNVNARGGDLVMVGCDSPYATIAVLSKPPVAILKPSDLVGKRIGVPPGTSQALAWPGFLQRNKIDRSSINVVSVELATMRTALMAGRIDGYLAYASSNLPLLHALGVAEPQTLLFADYGFRLAPDSGVVVKRTMIKDHPDMVKQLMAAVNESFEAAFADPAATARAAIELYPAAFKQDVIVQVIPDLASQFQHTHQPGMPLLAMKAADWEEQLGLLKEMAPDLRTGPAADYFTNDFLGGTK